MKRAISLAALPCLALAAYLLIPAPPLDKAASVSREVYDRKGCLLRLTLSSDDKYRRWVPLAQMSPLLVEAVQLQEDRHFRGHCGVNPYALLRAGWITYIKKKGRTGGSTITMQLARILYHINSKNIAGKLRQMLLALHLEAKYSKDEILEAYLNLIPYGANIEGAGTASLVYFGKNPDELTLSEALALCVIPKSPSQRNPGARKTAAGMPSILAARMKLFENWLARHPEDADKRRFMEMPVMAQAGLALPFYAPQFVNGALAQHIDGNILKTTLDLKLQRMAERQLSCYIAQQKYLGIQNAAALLLDTADMGVRASVGSADFFNAAIDGQVNGVQAQRSPGSALKPFVYALAIDQGLIHPMTLLKDAHFSYGGFNPENFDGDFVGPMHAKDALVKSRNIPAVQLAMVLKTPTFYELLKKTGLPLREENYYGLALPLGGVEISMQNLAELYVMLANDGIFRRAKTLEYGPLPSGQRLLSKEASFITVEMLKETQRPQQNFQQSWLKSGIPVAWKTGTSCGFRDAWSVGIFGHYVIAVWVGNFDGRPNPAFVGIQAAAPLMFRIIDSVRAQDASYFDRKPSYMENLRKVRVCAVSGQRPSAFCKTTAETWFIAGKSPIKRCEIHREVTVDADTGFTACPSSRSVRREVYEFWPSDILKIFAAAGMPRRVPPPENPLCASSRQAAGMPPQISSPQRGVIYTVRSNGPPSEIAFSAVTDADSTDVFWFLDGRLVGKTKPGATLFWKAQAGHFVLRAVDSVGRASSMELTVETAE